MLGSSDGLYDDVPGVCVRVFMYLSMYVRAYVCVLKYSHMSGSSDGLYG
jgi:hypothetical protein